VDEFQKALALSENSVTALTGLGHAFAISGKQSEALNVIKKLEELSKQHYVSPYHTAVINAGLLDFHNSGGDKTQALTDRTQALAWLEKARDERFNWIPFIQVDPSFDNLRSDPKFAALAQTIRQG